MSPQVATAASLNLQANGEADPRSPRELMREASDVCADMGLAISGGRLRTVVNRYLAHGASGIDFRTWFISYADPTGETAVRNVMRGGR